MSSLLEATLEPLGKGQDNLSSSEKWWAPCRSDDLVAEEQPRDLLDDLIDETSYKRGHRYLTGRVVWIGEGKSAETLAEFLAELGPHRAKDLELVTMDMSLQEGGQWPVASGQDAKHP